ncbi:Lysozyme-like [Lentibacillus halodurans]|uniref:Lysozyme-like n=1 Tax=Lentibacillus halodurans TaxID=237679 RepID=A0A1I0X8I9_9BACI|nr:lysozyme family protein [Lentibacillus halodurans]SFA96746.1 Lysozyme-like [Lentibacillus halodurans]
MKRKMKQAIKQTVMIAAVLCGVLIVISAVSLMGHDKGTSQWQSIVSDQVLDYQPLVEKYAAQYGVTEHVDVLLAMMMQESGGRGNDPMQSSESYCGSRGCIDDPEHSIEQGVHYFSGALEEADGDVKLAIQSYNFGKGFIDYIQTNSGTYTQEAAINFSQEMYAASDDQSKYRCPREEAKEIDACYGDIYYVRDVMSYTEAVASIMQ